MVLGQRTMAGAQQGVDRRNEGRAVQGRTRARASIPRPRVSTQPRPENDDE